MCAAPLRVEETRAVKMQDAAAPRYAAARAGTCCAAWQTASEWARDPARPAKGAAGQLIDGAHLRGSASLPVVHGPFGSSSRVEVLLVLKLEEKVL